MFGEEKTVYTIMKSIIHKYLKKYASYSSRDTRYVMRGSASEWQNFNGSSTTTRRIPHFQKCGNDIV